MEADTLNHPIPNLLDPGEGLSSASGPATGGAVEANVNYVVPPFGGNAVHVAGLGEGENERTAEYVSTPVIVHDARLAAGPATLRD